VGKDLQESEKKDAGEGDAEEDMEVVVDVTALREEVRGPFLSQPLKWRCSQAMQVLHLPHSMLMMVGPWDCGLAEGEAAGGAAVAQ
jgi:hypothetical protein